MGPHTGDVGIKLKMRICKVKKTCRPFRLTSAYLLKSTQKGMASSMVIV
jgi:hypothetical protein